MKLKGPFIFLLFWSVYHSSFAQAALDEKAFRSMSSAARYQSIQTHGFDQLDSAALARVFASSLFDIAGEKKDYRTLFALKYHYFQARKKLKPAQDEIFGLLTDMRKIAEEGGLEVEKVVAHHFSVFEEYDRHKIPHGQLYVSILQEFGRMEELGFEKFKDYNIARMLYHSGKFMYELEDYDKALQFLTLAERFIDTGNKGLQTAILVMNHLQSTYQQQKKYAEGIIYAKKILSIVQDTQVNNAGQQRLCREWEGIASIDIAAMLVGQHKIAEGEIFADRGYELVKAADESGMQAEYDALQVLVPTKLELGKMEEAAALLQRMDEIYKALGQGEYYFFRNIRFFEAYAKYHELKGDYAASVHYNNLAKPLRDSLERRNDARKLEKIQQRLEAEKYNEQLRLVESEKQLQKWLRNAALVILMLVLALAYGNYHRLQYKRRQALLALEAARDDLETFTKNLREKSELVDNLRLEIEKLSRSGERSEYLEQLAHSTILTDEDWLRFRNLFEKVHPGFLEEQKARHHDLTPAELRLLALGKLGLSDQESANMLGISAKTVHQTRWRMRKKTGD